MNEEKKELITRLLEHAELHENFCPFDDEQRQWADDLRLAAQLIGEVEED